MLALPPAWQSRGDPIIPNWPSEEMVKRCLEWGANDDRIIRRYLHNAFAADVDYPREDARIVDLRQDLAAEFGGK
jgi:hypothetical protein